MTRHLCFQHSITNCSHAGCSWGPYGTDNHAAVDLWNIRLHRSSSWRMSLTNSPVYWDLGEAAGLCVPQLDLYQMFIDEAIRQCRTFWTQKLAMFIHWHSIVKWSECFRWHLFVNLFVNTITSERLNIGCWNLMYKSLGQRQIKWWVGMSWCLHTLSVMSRSC